MSGRPHVLIIEDDAQTADVLTDFFELEGIRTTATGSAIGAVELLKRVRPDAVIMDLALPYRSGASLLGQLKDDPETASVPVIICSAFTGDLTPERAAQAAAVLSKPIDLRHLLSAVGDAVAKPTAVAVRKRARAVRSRRRSPS
ncbi:MAG TPA: response regulator [Chloroflexota bacterium]|nr:response regulator [Chloroflexota bacterium]